jgi:hypothetical protein
MLFKKTAEKSHQKRFSPYNTLSLVFLLLAVLIVPFSFVLRSVFYDLFLQLDIDLVNYGLWFLSILSMICALLAIITAVNGLNRGLGSKMAFSITVLVGTFTAIALSGLVFLPHMYILSFGI